MPGEPRTGDTRRNPRDDRKENLRPEYLKVQFRHFHIELFRQCPSHRDQKRRDLMLSTYMPSKRLSQPSLLDVAMSGVSNDQELHVDQSEAATWTHPRTPALCNWVTRSNPESTFGSSDCASRPVPHNIPPFTMLSPASSLQRGRICGVEGLDRVALDGHEGDACDCRDTKCLRLPRQPATAKWRHDARVLGSLPYGQWGLWASALFPMLQTTLG